MRPPPMEDSKQQTHARAMLDTDWPETFLLGPPHLLHPPRIGCELIMFMSNWQSRM
uniref:Uncharacterized protein n=1 Tax=Colobus angolensis palliatus TaxID=336983 RepID=A0A2K5IZD3_COLAP